ncbi:MAG: hypothetical protein NVS4B2_23180 [Chloroflexota bacterium]
MCGNCSPHRSGAVSDPHSTPDVPLAGRGAGAGTLLNTPISRARLLQTLGGGLALTLTTASLGWDAIQAATAPLPHLVLIVLDGARPEYFDVPGIPHIRALMRNGTRYTNAFAGILESETPSGHVSIATGSQPRDNGILSFAWAGNDNIRVNLFDPAAVRAGAMEAIMHQSRMPTIAGLVHARSPKATVVALSGSKYYAADALGGPDANIVMYYYGTPDGQFVPTSLPGHAPPAGILNAPGLTTKNRHIPLGVENHLAMKLAITTFQRTRQRVTLINLPEFDWPLGHVDGGVLDPQGVKTLMQRLDQDLAMLQDNYRAAGVLDQTLFVLTADHGMMPLTHKVDKAALVTAVTRAGTTLISDSYSSGAYLWVRDSGRALRAAQNIVNLRNSLIQSVYVKVQAKATYTYRQVSGTARLRTPGMAAANQYLLHSFAGPNGPDIVALFAEGAGSEPGGQASWKADHGGASWQAQHIPLVLSGPGIRRNHVTSSPARLMDIAPTALHAMGIPHPGMQGMVLADALAAPPTWATRTQKTANQHLLPVVTALQQESRLETAARL